MVDVAGTGGEGGAGRRWTLCRAGILNVYQYGDEVLRFAGGRLLLRGVNGSGKSTAMNMLLPFLLDADTRKIDAAGEQTGVLRSWMLSGRDEQQPVGYLWIELERGDDHLVCGCGIRANRSTDTVNTWWFVTPLRPGIDFGLLEGRVPLSVDGLRAALTVGTVFTKDQRAAYRAEVRNQLFGGAELDQHISLLHVIRNPRVGDRIDADLPAYLDDALPQLSDTAIDDAAQPLEDLEEHRRNVAALEQTATALDALASVYRSYARTELRDRAEAALERVREVAARRRAEARARRALDDAQRDLTEAKDQLEQTQASIERLKSEIEAQQQLPAYREGRRLEDLRGRVRSLRDELDHSARRLSHATERSEHASAEVDRAATTFHDDTGRLADRLTELQAMLTEAGVAAPVPDLPAPAVVEVEGIKSPHEPLDPAPTDHALGNVVAAIRARLQDVNQVRAALAQVDQATHALTVAEDDRRRAEEDHHAARDRVTERTTELHAELDELAVALRRWMDELLRIKNDIGSVVETATIPDEVPTDLLAGARALRGDLQGALLGMQALVGRHRATLEAKREQQRDDVERLDRELQELLARHEPEPPSEPWQRPTGAPRLAELVDFADGVDPDARLGLEAALEASGLLGAELVDGDVRLESGELVAVAGDEVAAPLSDLLVVTVPERHRHTVDPARVRAVLASISTDLASPTALVVTADGHFRAGALHGRHERATVEHVGATARAAALERQRDEVRRALGDAQAALAATDHEMAVATGHLDSLEAHAHELPRIDGVEQAAVQLRAAEDEVDRKLEQLEQSRQRVDQAEQALSIADDTARRTAATLGLPHHSDELIAIERVLREANEASRQARDALSSTLVRSCRSWIDAADRCRRAVRDAEAASADRDRLAAKLDPLAAKLDALERTLGADYERVVSEITRLDGSLRSAEQALPAARKHHDETMTAEARADAAVGVARDKVDEAERVCVAALPGLRAALAVPGLRAAVAEPPELDAPADDPGPAIDASGPPVDTPLAALPAVDETSDGVRALAEHVLAEVPPPEQKMSAESVRQSLRRRRDALGAGWDAEDHQRDETLPLMVEVNGPEGRFPLAEAAAVVRARLKHQASLLTAKQDQALRNLLQGLIAKEVATKLHAARELVARMNARLKTISTSHGIGVALRWKRRGDLDDGLSRTIDLLAKQPDLRTEDEDRELSADLSARINEARRLDPEVPYRQLIAEVLDYRQWHEMAIMLHRPGRNPERLSRRTALSEGEKKVVSYLPLFSAVAASCDGLAESAPDAPRFVLLDDAFAKVSEDNHAKLFGLLVELDLDFIATSERLWGTHDTVPELAITEVVRDADAGVILLEHARWEATTRSLVPS